MKFPFKSNSLKSLRKAYVKHAEEGLEQASKNLATDSDRLAKISDRAEAGMDKLADAAIDRAVKDANKNWFQRHKILTGLGALGAGGIAYNIAGPAGTPIADGGMSPEEAGAQRAVMDAMQSGYGQVQMGMPDTQISAANLNYEGPMMDAARAQAR